LLLVHPTFSFAFQHAGTLHVDCQCLFALVDLEAEQVWSTEQSAQDNVEALFVCLEPFLGGLVSKLLDSKGNGGKVGETGTIPCGCHNTKLG
jgi:hypothetical protein